MIYKSDRKKILFLSILREGAANSLIEEKIKQLSAREWEEVYKISCRGGLAAPLYKRILDSKLKNIPPGFLTQLKNFYFLNLKKNTILEKEFLRILGYLQEKGLKVMSLKGPVLARYLYADPGARQASVDLDFLVPKEDAGNVSLRLSELGYRFAFVEPKKDFLGRSGSGKKEDQIVFTKEIEDSFELSLDIHFSLRGFSGEKYLRTLWDGAQAYELENKSVLIPSSEDLLIFLCVISISMIESVVLKYVYDIHSLIGACPENIFSENTLRKINAMSLGSCVYLPLKISSELFGTKLPSSFLKAIKPGPIAERFLSRRINADTALDCPDSKELDFLSRLLTARYLYSSSLPEFLSKSVSRIKSRLAAGCH